jgi:hypothetical protein
MPRAQDSAAPVNRGATERYRRVLMPEAMQAADTVTRYYSKRRLPVSEDDVRSKAFLIAVDSLDNYDPAKGDVVPYMFEAARTGVGMEIARWLSPVGVSDSAIKRGVRPRAASAKATDDGDEPTDLLERIADAGALPDKILEHRRASAVYRVALARYEVALRRHLREHHGREIARAIASVLGLGRLRPRPADAVAECLGMPVRTLWRELHRFKNSVDMSPVLGSLRRDLVDVGSAA